MKINMKEYVSHLIMVFSALGTLGLVLQSLRWDVHDLQETSSLSTTGFLPVINVLLYNSTFLLHLYFLV